MSAAPKCAVQTVEATNAEDRCFLTMKSGASALSEQHRHLPGRIRTRNLVAVKHLGLAGLAAKRQKLHGPEEWDDLMQEASIGVLRGAERFDPNRGLKPSTYLLSCARGQVLHYRRDRSSIVRIPWRLRDLYAAGLKLQREREKANQPPLEDSHLATALGTTLQRWREACRCQLLTQTRSIGDREWEQGNVDNEDPQLLWLLQSMQRLTQADQRLLRSHLVQGQSLRQLVRITGMSHRQVRHRIDRLIAQLKDWAQHDGLLSLH